MRLPGVSYVVTIYNKAPYLEGVVRALAGQDGDFERQYVLVDDGSTDDSGALAARLVAGLPNRTLIRQPNAGPSVAVNRGIARGAAALHADRRWRRRAGALCLAAAAARGHRKRLRRGLWPERLLRRRGRAGLSARARAHRGARARRSALHHHPHRPCRRQHAHPRHRGAEARGRRRRARLRAGPILAAAHGVHGEDRLHRSPRLDGAASTSRGAS